MCAMNTKPDKKTLAQKYSRLYLRDSKTGMRIGKNTWRRKCAHCRNCEHYEVRYDPIFPLKPMQLQFIYAIRICVHTQ